MPATSTSSSVGAEHDHVGIAHVDRPHPAVGELLGLVRPEPGGPQVDRGLGHVDVVALEVLDRLDPGRRGHRERGWRHQGAQHRGLGQAAHPVAAHLGLAAVGVLQHHAEVGRALGVHDLDDPVGARRRTGGRTAACTRSAGSGPVEPGRPGPGSRCRHRGAW